jgi:hypothetical protein
LLQFTAADTVSLTLTPSVTSITLSGIVSVPDGSAAAPSIKIGGEENGFYSSASDVRVATAGVHRWTFNSSGVLAAGASGGTIQSAAGSVSGPPYAYAAETNSGWYRIGSGNFGFAIGGVKYVDWATTLAQFVMPVQARIPLSSETTGTLTTASANKKINASGGITLPASVFTADDAIIIDGNGTARTITRGSGLTMYVNGADSATATLQANGVMGVTYRSATVCILTGNVA